MEYHYSYLNFIGKQSITYDGKGEVIDGENKIAHLCRIHDCKNLVIKNVTFQNGNTNALRSLRRKDISFRTSQISIFEVIDGGAVVITGMSKVSFENCKFINNVSIMCGGAVSNQSSELITFRNCYFMGNSAGHTGAAIDNLTRNSKIIIDNCEFINNNSNVWHKGNSPHGHITIFPNTHAEVRDCTFTEGSIPIDFYNENDVTLFNNKYVGYGDWQNSLRNRQKATIIDRLHMSQKLYWLIPKTLGKVYYRVNPQLK